MGCLAMNSKQDYVTALCQFIDQSPSQFHATRSIEDLLVESGFAKLDETSHWNLKPAKKYYVTRNDSAIIAFVTAKPSPEAGFNIATAHTDSPAPKLKLGSLHGKHDQIPVETYGGDRIPHGLTDRSASQGDRIRRKTSNQSNWSISKTTQSSLTGYPLNRNATRATKSMSNSIWRLASQDRSSNKSTKPSQRKPDLSLPNLDVELFLYDANRQKTRSRRFPRLSTKTRQPRRMPCLTLAISKETNKAYSSRHIHRQ